MNATQLPKYQSTEENGNRKPRNQPGIYRHEGSGKEVITSADPSDGSIQADAFVRVGYHRIGDVPSRLEMQKRREKRDAEAAEALKNEVPGEAKEQFNGTTDQSVTELKEAKEKAEAELAETKATLEALKSGMSNKDDKNKEK